jgi:predicted NBD/HSP70 family sugar kinase
VLGVPGIVDARDGTLRLTTPNIPGLEGRAFADELGAALGVAVTPENDVNLAALGERWRGVARDRDDFAFLSIGTGLGAGLVLRGELHRGHHGAAGEVDYAFGMGLERDIDPCAEALLAFVREQAAGDGRATALSEPFGVPDVFAAARDGDELARVAVAEEARRIALHIAPIAAVTDIALVVLGGGIGANGDLLLDPIRGLLAEWLPFPPRVEVSGLGDAAVLTGALAVGLELAQERVFDNRHDGQRAATGTAVGA